MNKDQNNMLDTSEVVSEFEIMDEEDDKDKVVSEPKPKEYIYQHTIFEPTEKDEGEAEAVSQNSIEYVDEVKEQPKPQEQQKPEEVEEIKLPKSLQISEDIFNLEKKTVYSKQQTEINFAEPSELES